MKAKMYDRIDIFLKSLLLVYDIVIGFLFKFELEGTCVCYSAFS